MTGVEMIARERDRQMTDEHFDSDHDDEHDLHELLWAAVCYASEAGEPGEGHALWPWSPSWWKPSDDPIRNLVKAGALIAAEIDRLQRA